MQMYNLYGVNINVCIVGAGPTSQDPQNNQSRRKRKNGPSKIKCGKCGGPGHNRRTCKGGENVGSSQNRIQAEVLPPDVPVGTQGNVDFAPPIGQVEAVMHVNDNTYEAADDAWGTSGCGLGPVPDDQGDRDPQAFPDLNLDC